MGKSKKKKLPKLPEGWRFNQRGYGPLDITDVMEAVCPHGVGHPVGNLKEGEGIHGCCGCCSLLG